MSAPWLLPGQRQAHCPVPIKAAGTPFLSNALLLPPTEVSVLTWNDMIDLFPAGHLVTGIHPPDKLNRVKLLIRLVDAMGPDGEWAIRTSVDSHGENIVQVLFERKEDADRLGDAVKARRTGTYPSCASQRVFGFDKPVARKIAAVLG